MYPVINQNPNQNPTGHSFWDQFSDIQGSIESRIPTFDRSLDAYFDQNFDAIIKEWDLVTESDLLRLETRLTRVTDEISGLYTGKVTLEARAAKLDELISQLERSV
jgi:predicted nuclease of restriction endonuclease-like RecB superfamily